MSIAANSLTTADFSLRNRRVLLAPICLCLVAGLHLWRVNAAGQTPWKGGGFGMFSTIDGENARFVRANLETKDGSLPIEIPSELNKKIAELRAAPNQQGLQELAQRLANRDWIDPQLAQQRRAANMKIEPAGVPLTGERLRALRNAPLVRTADPTYEGTVVAMKKGEHLRYAIAWRAVRVELWKYEMPAGTSNLQAKLLFTASTSPEAKP